MSEAQDIYQAHLSTYCDSCDAEVGEPCRAGCAALDAQGLIDTYAADQEAARKAREVPAEVQLYRALHQLPYAGTQPDVAVPAPGVDLNEWTAQIAEWIRGYAAWDRKEMVEAEHHRRRSISLDAQIGGIRTFFHEEILRGGQYGYAR